MYLDHLADGTVGKDPEPFLRGMAAARRRPSVGVPYATTFELIPRALTASSPRAQAGAGWARGRGAPGRAPVSSPSRWTTVPATTVAR